MTKISKGLTFAIRCRRSLGTILAGMGLAFFAEVAFAQTAADRAWTVLQAGLTDEAVDDRAAAVRLLGLIEKNPKAAEFALKALSDEKVEVRTAAADALAQMRDRSAESKLVEVAKAEKDPAVVIACAH
jgi:HEAT repeat protein